MKRMLFFFLVVAMLCIAIVPVAFAQQETCPNTGGGWTKVDGLTGTTYVFNVTAGWTLTQVCYKASTSVIYLNVNVVGPNTYTVTSTVENQNGQVQDLSHASFYLVETPEPPCEGEECNPCEGEECNPCEGEECNPCEGEECNPCEGEECNPCEGEECNPCERDCDPDPVCERNCEPTPPPSGPQGCVLQPFAIADAGNSVDLRSPDGSVVYYTLPVEGRGDYAVVNIGSWVNVGQYGLYYSDGRLIGQLTITANSRGDLSCIVTQVPPEEEVVICTGCGPRVEEWYVNPETGNTGRIIEANGWYYIESPENFEGASERETPLGTVYYLYGSGGTLEGSDIYVPCSVTVQLSQATDNGDGTWTFTVLPFQWRSEWELAAQRFGFGPEFVEAAMATPVGGTFTVDAPQ